MEGMASSSEPGGESMRVRSKFLYPVAAFLLVVLVITGASFAQLSTNDVHVVPRSTPDTPEKPANSIDPELQTHTAPIKKDVDLVLVPVTDFTRNVDEIQNKLVFTGPKGRTALLDAVYLGMHKMKQAKNQKKALLIISDGGDNHSRYTESEIKSQIKEADVMIYSVGIYDHSFPTIEEKLGPELLNEMSEVTGGRSFTIDNPNDLPDVASKIGMQLRNQYVLGYRPSKVQHDGKWHKIKVKLHIPKGLPPLQVYARTGYYAAAQ